jgi:phthalate 4,5-dioxygenase reductase subunit
MPEFDADGRMRLAVTRAEPIAGGIHLLEVRDPSGADLPEFTPGAHVVVRTPNGALRSYSLCGDPVDRHRYEFAVKREATGRGGSVNLVDEVHAGGMLAVSLPMNNFALTKAKEHVFVAGGIGVTPILSMIRYLVRTGEAKFRLYFLTRSPETTPFLDELRALPAGTVRIHHDRGDPSKMFDLWPVFENPTSAHIYCCGPTGLMDSVRDMTGHWSGENVHFESFTNPAGEHRADDTPFTVRIASTGMVVQVPADCSILEALRRAGLRVPSSCESGTCGSCRTRLVAGTPDHRDLVLTEAERADHVMVCVSRAKTPELVIELPGATS